MGDISLNFNNYLFEQLLDGKLSRNYLIITMIDELKTMKKILIVLDLWF